MIDHASSKMMTIRIPSVIFERVATLSKKTHRTKAFFVREAILDHLEDLEDYYEAIDALNDRDEPIPADEFWKLLDV